MKLKTYSLILIFAATALSAQNYYDYDSEIINYTILSKDKTTLYENAFFKEKRFSPEEFVTNMSELSKNYDIKLENPGKNATIELTTLLYDNFNTTTPFKNKVVDGIKKIYFPGGILFQEIPFKNGKIEGIYKVYDQSGAIFSETPYKDNVKNGIKKVHFKDEKDRNDTTEYLIEGTYKAGKLVGSVTITNEHVKIIYPSDFKKGKVELLYSGVSLVDYTIIERGVKNGLYTTYSIDTNRDKADPKKVVKRIKRFSADYFNNEFNGYVEKYNKDGELLSKNLFRFGKPVGTHKNYYDVGKIKSESYYDDNGNKTGTWKTYGLSGDLVEVSGYQNNKLHGVKETYQKDKLKTKEIFQNGDRMSNQYFDNDGKLQIEAFYDKNNFIKEISYFKDGKTQSLNNAGKEKTFYDKDGNIIHSNVYKNGKPVGIHKFIDYDKDGGYRIFSESEYNEKGSKVRSIGFGMKGAYTESYYKNEKLHGKYTTNSEDGTQKVVYYFEGKTVTEDEFKKFTAEETKK